MIVEDLKSLEGASPPRERILDDHHGCGAWNPSLDPLPGAVILGTLPHREGVEGGPFEPTSVGDGVGERVGAEGESSDPTGAGEVGANGLEADNPDEKLSLRRHCGEAGIDVIGRTSTAGECKLPEGERAFDQKREKAIAMAHTTEVPPVPVPVKARRVVGFVSAMVLAWLLPACDGPDPIGPVGGFGEVGEVQVEVRSPLGQPLGGPQLGLFQGTLTETLRWRSNGGWTLAERVSYLGILGSETVRRSRLNPGELTDEYRILVFQLTEAAGTRLLGTVSQDILPACGGFFLPQLTTQVTVTIQDTERNETARWVRCTRGIFVLSALSPDLNPATSGPDAEAERVVTAAQLARFFTIGSSTTSTYAGTVPFGTLDRGEYSPALPTVSRIFTSSDGGPPQEFRAFWALHAGPTAELPEVNWFSQSVLLGAIGARQEAGDSVQVRGVHRATQGHRVDVVERLPGDFCSPAEKRVYPFHIVVLPSISFPIEFAAPLVERITCGF